MSLVEYSIICQLKKKKNPEINMVRFKTQVQLKLTLKHRYAYELCKRLLTRIYSRKKVAKLIFNTEIIRPGPEKYYESIIRSSRLDKTEFGQGIFF